MKKWRWTKTIEVEAETCGEAMIAVRDALLTGALKACDSVASLEEVSWDIMLDGELIEIEPVPSEGGN